MPRKKLPDAVDTAIDIWMPEPKDKVSREEYIAVLSREILIELIKADKRILPDMAKNAVTGATTLADLLNIR